MLSKWYAAFIHIAITVAGVLGTAIAAPADLSVWLQIGVVFLGAVVTWAVPLLNTRWQAGLKVVLGGVLPALIVAAIPFIPAVGDHFEPQNIFPFILALLGALGAQIGVDVRVAAAAPIDAGEAIPGIPVTITTVGQAPQLPADPDADVQHV